MNSTIGWIALGGALVLVLWIMLGNWDAQATCEQTHSRDTCFLALNP